MFLGNILVQESGNPALILRAQTVSNFSGLEPFWVSYYELRLVSGEKLVQAYLAQWALFEPSISNILLSPVEPHKKLAGLAKIWAQLDISSQAFLPLAYLQARAFEPSQVPRSSSINN